jgi:hypothetical protein
LHVDDNRRAAAFITVCRKDAAYALAPIGEIVPVKVVVFTLLLRGSTRIFNIEFVEYWAVFACTAEKATIGNSV